MQTALTRVYLKWDRIDTPLAYARKALVTAHIDSTRRRWWGERPTETLPEVTATESADVGAADERDELRRLLAGLSPKERAVIVLRYYCDLSEQDTAATLGVPVGTVKSTCSRALSRLRVEIGVSVSMSPSESQLRAALRDGEGDAPDAAALISHARARAPRAAPPDHLDRHRRRRRGRGRGRHRPAGIARHGRERRRRRATARRADAPAGGASRRRRPAATAETERRRGRPAAVRRRGPSSSGARASASGWPARAAPARYMLPGGGGSAQFGSNEQVVRRAGSSAMKVCALSRSVARARRASTVLTRPSRAPVRHALESAPRRPASAARARDDHRPSGTVEILRGQRASATRSSRS